MMKAIARNRAMQFLAAVVGMLFLNGAMLAQQPEVRTIRFVGVPSAGSMVVWLAQDRGFFKAEGIDFQLQPDLAAGLVTDNLLSGNAEMVYGGIGTMLMPFAKGAPIVTIATTDYNTLWEVVVHPDSAIKSAEDLRGKSIAVIAPNSICVIALRRMAEMNGWPRESFKFQVVPPPNQVAAFGAKRVDASCMFDPIRTQLKGQFGATSVWSILDPRWIVGGSLGGGVIMHKDFVAKNPNTVAAIQRAVSRSAELAGKNPDAVYEVLAKVTRQDIARVRAITLPRYASPPVLTEYMKETADALLKYGFVNDPIDVAGFDRTPRLKK